MKKTLLITGMAIVLALVNGCATTKPSCPNIAGSWHSDRSGGTMDIVQSDCHISSKFSLNGYDHVLKGRWAGDRFRYTVARTKREDGRTTILHGSLVDITPTQMTSIVTRTDGKSDLGMDFHQELTWTKVQDQ